MVLVHQPFHGPWLVRKKTPLNMKVGSLINFFPFQVSFDSILAATVRKQSLSILFFSTSVEFLDLSTIKINFNRFMFF